MTPPAEQRIREYLEKRGRPSSVTARKLIGTWRITDPDPGDRRMVAEALAREGLVVEPPIEVADLDVEVVVRLAAPGELEERRSEEEEREAAAEVAREAQRRAEEAEARAEERAARERAEARAAEEARAAREARELEARAARERAEAQAAEEARAAQEARARREAAAARAAERGPTGDEEREGDRPWSGRRWRERAARRERRGTPTAVPEPTALDRGEEPLEEPAEEEPALPTGLGPALMLAGAALIVVALFLPWYSGERGGIEVQELTSGWDWLGTLDIVLAAIAVASAALLVLRPADPLAYRALGAGAVVGLAGVAYRIGAPPDDALGEFILEVDRRIGPFVALLAVAAVVLGAGLTADEVRAEESVEGEGAGDAEPSGARDPHPG